MRRKEGIRPRLPMWPQDPWGGTDDDPEDGRDEEPDRPEKTPQPDRPGRSVPGSPTDDRPA